MASAGKKNEGERMETLVTDQKVDSKGRIILPKELRDCNRVIIQQVSDVECRIIRANVVPALSKTSEAMLLQGIEDAKAGRISPLDMDLLADDD